MRNVTISTIFVILIITCSCSHLMVETGLKEVWYDDFFLIFPHPTCEDWEVIICDMTRLHLAWEAIFDVPAYFPDIVFREDEIKMLWIPVIGFIDHKNHQIWVSYTGNNVHFYNTLGHEDIHRLDPEAVHSQWGTWENPVYNSVQDAYGVELAVKMFPELEVVGIEETLHQLWLADEKRRGVYAKQ